MRFTEKLTEQITAFTDQQIDNALASAPLDPAYEALFRAHLRTVDARETCLICDAGRYSCELRGGLIARVCAQCGFIALFDPAALGLQPGWRLRDGVWLRALVPADSPPGEMDTGVRIEGGRMTLYREVRARP